MWSALTSEPLLTKTENNFCWKKRLLVPCLIIEIFTRSMSRNSCYFLKYLNATVDVTFHLTQFILLFALSENRSKKAFFPPGDSIVSAKWCLF